MRRCACVAVVLAALTWWHPVAAQRADSILHLAATTDRDLRTWDAYVTSESRAGGLRLRSTDRDPSLPGRSIERFQQYYRGVRVWGGDVVRDSESGAARSIFGELTSDLSLSVDPALDVARAAILIAAGSDNAVLLRQPELVVLPVDGTYRLAYTGVRSAAAMDVQRVFVDAMTGAELLRYSEIQTQSAVGTGRGLVGDDKKVSTSAEGGVFYTDDRLRPPSLRTYDMRGNIARTVAILNGAAPLLASDRASDADNNWTDGQAVDAHVYIGWTYDYYFKRHGRRGLDNRDRPIQTMIDAVSPQQAVILPDVPIDFVLNAFWCDTCGPGATGVMFFGSGIPSTFTLVSSGQTVTSFAGSIDIAAHELTHAVTSSSSNLIYLNESGALNEAFSDIIGASVEFFFQSPGTGLGRADYLLGEDTYRASRPGSINGSRSLENPGLFGQPDHYSRRVLGPADNGGVHTNSGIANHAFYLAIEGGTNRTSGLTVQGVGAANREQIEKVFYRAFVFLMNSSANFATARAATIQASRDLYGAGSAAERAVTQAWTAVGVL